MAAAFPHGIGDREPISPCLVALANVAAAHHRTHKDNYRKSDVEYREQSCKRIRNDYVSSGFHRDAREALPLCCDFKILKLRDRIKKSFGDLDVVQFPQVDLDHAIRRREHIAELRSPDDLIMFVGRSDMDSLRGGFVHTGHKNDELGI